jgi:DNA helicase-2/ATP-dependent DNA helicase PcrA
VSSDLLRQARTARDTSDLRAWAVDLAWPDPETAGAGGEDDEDRVDPAAALEAVRAFEAAGGGGGPAFAAWVALHDFDAGPGVDAVDLVTIHSAKGREWPVVIVAGVDAAMFPAPASLKSRVRQEEARVLYVAMTRAMDKLALTWCERRNGTATSRSPVLPSLERVLPPGELGVIAPPRHLRRARPPTADPVLTRLTEWRSRAAHAAGVPPDFVLDDATLRRLATVRPTTQDELAGVEGVGPIAASQFGARLLPLLVDQPS